MRQGIPTHELYPTDNLDMEKRCLEESEKVLYTFEFGISMPKRILGTVSKAMVPQII